MQPLVGRSDIPISRQHEPPKSAHYDGIEPPPNPPLSRTGLPHPPKSGRMLTLFYGRHLQLDNLMLNGHPKNKLLAHW
jgi:hypothetical protein